MTDKPYTNHLGEPDLDWSFIQNKFPKSRQAFINFNVSRKGYSHLPCPFDEMYRFFDAQGIYINVIHDIHLAQRGGNQSRTFFSYYVDNAITTIAPDDEQKNEYSTRAEAEVAAFLAAFDRLETQLNQQP